MKQMSGRMLFGLFLVQSLSSIAFGSDSRDENVMALTEFGTDTASLLKDNKVLESVNFMLAYKSELQLDLDREPVLELSNAFGLMDEFSQDTSNLMRNNESMDLYYAMFAAFEDRAWTSFNAALDQFNAHVTSTNLPEEMILLSSLFHLRALAEQGNLDDAAKVAMFMQTAVQKANESADLPKIKIVLNKINREVALEALAIAIALNNGAKVRMFDSVGFPRMHQGYHIAEKLCDAILDCPDSKISTRAYVNRGIARIRQGNFQEGKDDLDRVLSNVYIEDENLIKSVILAQAELCCLLQMAKPYMPDALELSSKLYLLVYNSAEIGGVLGNDNHVVKSVTHAKRFVRERFAATMLSDANRLMEDGAYYGVRLYCERILARFPETLAAQAAMEMVSSFVSV